MFLIKSQKYLFLGIGFEMLFSSLNDHFNAILHTAQVQRETRVWRLSDFFNYCKKVFLIKILICLLYICIKFRVYPLMTILTLFVKGQAKMTGWR